MQCGFDEVGRRSHHAAQFFDDFGVQTIDFIVTFEDGPGSLAVEFDVTVDASVEHFE